MAASLFADETNRPPADVWLTNQFTWPDFVQTQAVATARFETLHAGVSAGRFKVSWSPAQMETASVVCLFASADAPGHWPVRDWHGYQFVRSATSWTAKVPVDDVYVPIAYFLCETRRGATNFSPMRLAVPRGLGMEEPTRIFWPFLEGFEDGPGSWHLTAPDCGSMEISPESRHGLAALLVTLPAHKRSVAIGTTRIRGWQAAQHGIRGVSVWLRTRGGEVRVRFILHANAFTPKQVLSVSSLETRLGEDWRQVDVPFDSFPKLALVNADWFTLEFIADGPREILVDDLQYLGPWKLD